MSHIEIAKESTKGSVTLFIGSVFSTLLLAISAIIIARLLGPAGYGEYTLALLIPNIVFNLVGLGVLSGITRLAALNVARGDVTTAKRMTINGVAFLLPFGLLLSIATYLSAGYLASTVLNRPSLTSLAQVASWLIFAQTVEQTAMVAMQGWREMGLLSITNLAQALLRLAIATGLVVLGFGVFGAVLGSVLSYVVAGALVFPLFYSRMRAAGGNVFGKFFGDIKEMISYGFALYAGSVINVFSSQFVTIVLAAVATDAVVGSYQYATLFIAAIHVTATAFAVALFPAFTHLEGTKSDVGLAFKYAVQYSGLIISPVIFFLIGASPALVTSLGGESYSSASSYLVLLSLSNVPQVVGMGVLPPFFGGVGKTGPLLTYLVASSLAQIALAPLLGIELGLGVPGLIYSILITNIFSTALGLYLARKYVGALPNFRAFVTTLLSSAVSCGAILIMQSIEVPLTVLLVLQADVFLWVYLTVSPILGAVDHEDILRLRISSGGLGRFSYLAGIVLDYESLVLRIVKRSPAVSAGGMN